MSLPIERNATVSRKAALAKARQSRRPSRLGTPAGVAAKPDYLVASGAGFPALLARTWQKAVAADLPAAVDTLLTLAGHVPADVQLRALRQADECALRVLFGRSWREDSGGRGAPERDGKAAFLGEIGLNQSGRVVVRVPSGRPLSGEHDLVGGVLRVPWSAQALAEYQAEAHQADVRFGEATADCRAWLAAAGHSGRADMLATLTEAAFRTAPFVLYQGNQQYTNFRDRNTLTGKTLWPGHPDCALSSLRGVPFELWADSDVLLVACLTVLISSGGYARIEEANGTQLTPDHVGYLLERTRLAYNGVPGGQAIPPARSGRVADLSELAGRLGQRRRDVLRSVTLYREIHGPLMHKIERVAGSPGRAARKLEHQLAAELSGCLPASGQTLAELGASVEASPDWLAQPCDGFGTGLEALVFQTVRVATRTFTADFAMSRGLRSLTALVTALRAERWEELTTWDLPHYYCCVVPAPGAQRHFGGSLPALCDMAWAISSRMRYNSWHFLAGNLPKAPEVLARDYFVPPTIPDIAYYSDQHHHGHVAAKVRFSIRSPQAVQVLGRPFGGFVDLRLLRCDGEPFDEQDMIAADRTSALIARATSAAVALAAAGADVELTSFDSQWHWARIAA